MSVALDAADAVAPRSCAVALACVPGLQARAADERHAAERPLVLRAWREWLGLPPAADVGEVVWGADGKPRLVPTDPGARALDVSISHDDVYVMCVVGDGPQGCDLEAVAARDPEDWAALLGRARFALAAGLAADVLDVACTRIWSALEAARKATGTLEVELSLAPVQSGAAVGFIARTEAACVEVTTTMVTLSRGPQRVVAICRAVAPPPPVPTPVATRPSAPLGMEVEYDPRLGCHVLQWTFLVGHRDAPSLGRNVIWSRFFPWYGRMRDLVLGAEVGREFVAEILRGDTGGVTHAVTGSFFGRASAYDTIRARLAVVAIASELVTMQAWFDRVDGDRLTPLAVIRNDTSAAVVDGHGSFRVAPPPRSHVERYLPFVVRRPLALPESPRVDGSRFVAAPGPAGGPVVARERFRTALEDANVIGNVYFATHFALQQRTVDLLMHGIAPALFRSDAIGELVCRHTSMRFLRDAMPFDEIEVDVRLQALGHATAELRCELFRRDDGERRTKLAVASHHVGWERTADGTEVAWPDELVAGLLHRAHTQENHR